MVGYWNNEDLTITIPEGSVTATVDYYIWLRIREKEDFNGSAEDLAAWQDMEDKHSATSFYHRNYAAYGDNCVNIPGPVSSSIYDVDLQLHLRSLTRGREQHEGEHDNVQLFNAPYVYENEEEVLDALPRVIAGDYIAYQVYINTIAQGTTSKIDSFSLYVPDGLKLVTERDNLPDDFYFQRSSSSGYCGKDSDLLLFPDDPSGSGSFSFRNYSNQNETVCEGYDDLYNITRYDYTVSELKQTEQYLNYYVICEVKDTDLEEILEEANHSPTDADYEKAYEWASHLCYLLTAEVSQINGGDEYMQDDDAYNDNLPFNDWSDMTKATPTMKNPLLYRRPKGSPPDVPLGPGEIDNRVWQRVRSYRDTQTFNPTRDEDDFDFALVLPREKKDLSQQKSIIKSLDSHYSTPEHMTNLLAAFNTNYGTTDYSDYKTLTAEGKITDLKTIVPYTVVINPGGAKEMTDVHLKDTLPDGMSFLTDPTGAYPIVFIQEGIERNDVRFPALGENGEEVMVIDHDKVDWYNINDYTTKDYCFDASGQTVSLHKPDAVSSDNKWSYGFTDESDEESIYVDFGDIKNNLYSVTYFAVVDKYSFSYQNNAVITGATTEEATHNTPDWEPSGNGVRLHGNVITDAAGNDSYSPSTSNDLDDNTIYYRLYLSFSSLNYDSMAFTATDYIDDLFEGTNPENVSFVGTPWVAAALGADTGSEGIFKVTTHEALNERRYIHIQNTGAITGTVAVYIYFGVKYDTIPAGTAIRNVFGNVTTNVYTPLQLDLTNKDADDVVMECVTFELQYQNGTAVKDLDKENITLITDADGTATATFLPTGYDKSGVSTWNLKLVETTPSGYYPLGQDSKSAPAATIPIVITRDANNKFTVRTDSKSYYAISPGAANEIAIEVMNIRISATPAIANLSATKELTQNAESSYALAEDQFSFTATLTSNNASGVTGLNSGVATAKNKANGTVTFPELTFTKAGTYVFNIKETNSGDSRFTYDTNTYTATVVVSLDSGTNALSSTITYSGDNEPTFTNIVKTPTPATASLAATKWLDGKPSATVFDFQVAFNTAKSTDDITAPIIPNEGVVQNTGDGSITLAGIEFFDDGTYVFDITETSTGGDYHYDTAAYTATVTIEWNAANNAYEVDGDIVYKNASDVQLSSGITFENSTQRSIWVEKITAATGSPLSGATFELFYQTENVADPLASLGTFTTADGGLGSIALPADYWTYTYLLREITAPSGYVATKVGDVSFTVNQTTGLIEDVSTTGTDGYAVLINASGDRDGIGFLVKNDAKPVDPGPGPDPVPKPATLSLQAKKTLDGKAPGDAEFQLELRNESGFLLETLTATGTGSVKFSALSFDAEGDYVYTISELVETGTGYDYDEDVCTATISVTKKGANYSASVTYDKDGAAGIPVFANKTVTIETSVSVTKAWSAPAEVTLPASIHVQLLRDGSAYGAPALLDDSNGWTVEWTKLAGEHTWTVAEPEVPEGYTSSIAGSEGEYTITNTYQSKETPPVDPEPTPNPDPDPEPDPARITLGARKSYNGGLPSQGAFRFVLSDENGNLLQTKANNGSGTVAFDSIAYTSEGTYRYTIHELNMGNAVIVYDNTVFEAEVVVTAGNNEYSAALYYYQLAEDGGRTPLDALPQFENASRPVDPGDEPFVELDENDVPLGTWYPDPEEGWIFVELEDNEIPLDSFKPLPTTGSYTLAALLIFGTALIIGGAVLTRRKEEEEE